MMPDRLLDVATVARRLGVADETVRLWIRKGLIPETVHTHTGRLKIPASTLGRLRNTQKSVSDPL